MNEAWHALCCSEEADRQRGWSGHGWAGRAMREHARSSEVPNGLPGSDPGARARLPGRAVRLPGQEPLVPGVRQRHRDAHPPGAPSSGGTVMDAEPQDLTDEQVAYYQRVLLTHGSIHGASMCHICGVARCPDWVDAYDRLATAGRQ